MALLQLAESPYSHLAENEMYLAENPVGDNYIFIPAGMLGMDRDTYVRYDFFESLGDAEFAAAMEALAPFQPQGLSAVGAIVGGAVAVGQKVAPAIGKAIENRKEKVAAGTAKPLFKPGGALANLGGKIKAGVDKLKNVPAEKVGEVIDKTTPISGQVTVGGTNVDFSTGQTAPTGIAGIWEQYKKPILIGGGLVAAYFIAKKAKLF